MIKRLVAFLHRRLMGPMPADVRDRMAFVTPLPREVRSSNPALLSTVLYDLDSLVSFYVTDETTPRDVEVVRQALAEHLGRLCAHGTPQRQPLLKSQIITRRIEEYAQDACRAAMQAPLKSGFRS